MNSLSLKAKFMLAFTVVCALSAVLGLINVYSLSVVSEKYEHIAKVNLGNAQILIQMRSAASDTNTAVMSAARPAPAAPAAASFSLRASALSIA